ncbi:MAG: hypothetical protein EOP05_14285 [Proteobacteria bacterium]|nr:MAG: hypothetical protein EOP05_14285 [Pseudomonadota bacterium]
MKTGILTVIFVILVTATAQAVTPISIPASGKICFGETHPRCFELKNSDYSQSTRYGVEGPIKLDLSEKARLWKAVHDYRGWLRSEIAKRKTKPVTCSDTVKYEDDLQKEDLCLDGINKKMADTKTKTLLSILGRPKAAAPTEKKSSAQKPKK